MKIKELIPIENVKESKNFIDMLINENCHYHIIDGVKGYNNFIIYTESVKIRKHIYSCYYFERLIDDEKEENKNKLEKRTI